MSACQNKGDYLLVEVNEPYSLKLIVYTIHEVADHCRKDNLNKVFIDIRKMEGNPGIFERYQIGVEIVKVWGSRIKAAVIARPEIVNRVAENTAINRGAKLLVTLEIDDALKWLDVKIPKETAGA